MNFFEIDIKRDQATRNYNPDIKHDIINLFEAYTDKKSKQIPHEWIFINYLYKYEIQKNDKLAEQFKMFVWQFYPNNIDFDYLFTPKATEDIVFAAMTYDYNFIRYYVQNDKVNLEKAMLFGEIVTDFLIRYRNYSLIGCSGQKTIITARRDCEKHFEEQLCEGYSIQKRAKIGYVELPLELQLVYPGIKGFFKKLNVYPLKESLYTFDEVIEDSKDNYTSVLRLAYQEDNK